MAGFKSYYSELISDNEEQISLNPEETHHLIKVLRAKLGDPVTIFNNRKQGATAVLINTDSKHAVLKIINRFKIPNPSCSIVLAQAMPKGKGMEQIIQKATEIGVSKIIPLKTSRTELKLEGERQEKRIERWQATAIESCKQSGNFIIPEISDVQSLDDFFKIEKLGIENEGSSLKLIASLESHAKSLKTQKPQNPLSITWLIGPEGDFTPEEYAKAAEVGFIPISLSKNVLRVETAVGYALSVTDFLIN